MRVSLENNRIVGNRCYFFRFSNLLRGGSDVESRPTPLTMAIFFRTIWKIKSWNIRKKSWKKWKKLPKKSIFGNTLFFIVRPLFSWFCKFSLKFYCLKTYWEIIKLRYLCIKKKEYFSTNIPKKIKEMDEMAKQLGKH